MTAWSWARACLEMVAFEMSSREAGDRRRQPAPY
jgi:hypothetical protein